MDISIPPLSPIQWNKCWRIIPSCFPTIDLFERIAPKEDRELIAEVESLTNERLRDERGDISLVPGEDRVSGPGTSFIMAPFTHLNPQGSRFSDGTWGVYYASDNLQTAIAETKFHREKFMKATAEPPMHLDMRVLVARVKAELHDIRGSSYIKTPLYDADSYSASQVMAKQLKKINSNGIIYISVRDTKGQNVALFKPKVISGVTQERHLEYVWDGNSISSIFEKTLLRN